MRCPSISYEHPQFMGSVIEGGQSLWGWISGMFGSNDDQQQVDATEKKLNPRMKTVRMQTPPPDASEPKGVVHCGATGTCPSNASDVFTSCDTTEVCDVVQSIGSAEDSALTASNDIMSVSAETPATDNDKAAAKAMCTSTCDVLTSEHQEPPHANGDVSNTQPPSALSELSTESAAAQCVRTVRAPRIVYSRRSNGSVLTIAP